MTTPQPIPPLFGETTLRKDQPGGYAGLDASGAVAVKYAVTKEAPVNPMHPDFGAVFDGTTDDTAAINAAVAHAGSNGEVILPGIAKITARIQCHSANGLKLYGVGPMSGGLVQHTNNEPIIEWNSTTGIFDNALSDLFLQYAAQQNLGNHPNSAAIRFLTTVGTSGVFTNSLRSIRVDKATYGVRWKEVAPAVGCAFWNNTLDTIHMTNISGSLLSNGSTSEEGSPTNWCTRLTHLGAGGSPGGPSGAPALDLGAGVEWVFTSLDIEDWTDQLIHAFNPEADISINGFHIERHTVLTNNINIIQVSGGALLHLVGLEGYYVLNHSGTAYLFFSQQGGGVGSRGYIGNIVSNKDAGSTGAGTLQHFNFDFPPTAFMLGPRLSNSASIIDWATSASYPVRAVMSDQGLPPVWDSSLGLPTASANYRGRRLFYQGTNGTSPDRPVICRQDSLGNFAWVKDGARQRRAFATSTTTTVDDGIIAATATASTAQTVTLASAASLYPGYEILVKDEGGGAATHNVTIAANAADGIDGGALGGSITINTSHGFARLYCTGVAGANAWMTA